MNHSDLSFATWFNNDGILKPEVCHVDGCGSRGTPYNRSDSCTLALVNKCWQYENDTDGCPAFLSNLDSNWAREEQRMGSNDCGLHALKNLKTKLKLGGSNITRQYLHQLYAQAITSSSL